MAGAMVGVTPLRQPGGRGNNDFLPPPAASAEVPFQISPSDVQNDLADEFLRANNSLENVFVTTVAARLSWVLVADMDLDEMVQFLENAGLVWVEERFRWAQCLRVRERILTGRKRGLALPASRELEHELSVLRTVEATVKARVGRVNTPSQPPTDSSGQQPHPPASSLTEASSRRVVLVVRDTRGHFLMRRCGGVSGDDWTFIGRDCAAGEDPVRVLLREIVGRAGIVGLTGLGVLFEILDPLDPGLLLMVFAGPWDGDPRKLVAADGQVLAFHSPDTLATLDIVVSARAILNKLLPDHFPLKDPSERGGPGGAESSPGFSGNADR